METERGRQTLGLLTCDVKTVDVTADQSGMLDALQFSKRAVIMTFTVCGTAGWILLLLLETLEG